jgi:NAD(P)-dependent dehydrogenase (short-subunit alcohol dehydrogenase family)
VTLPEGRSDRSYQRAMQSLLQQAGHYRLIPLTEVADAIVRLCRQDAVDINGEAIPMDGGGWDP